jgi:hypothetical protein
MVQQISSILLLNIQALLLGKIMQPKLFPIILYSDVCPFPISHFFKPAKYRASKQ